MQKTDITFDKVLTLWLENKSIRLKGGTINKYYNVIEEHLKPDFCKCKISDLSSNILNKYLMDKIYNGRLDKTGGLSTSYVRSMALIINSAIKYAADEHLCAPFNTPVYLPVVVRKEQEILTLSEQLELEKYLYKNLDLAKTGILISLHSGLRIGEICALQWDDIDLEKHILHVRHTIARVKNNLKNGAKTYLVLDAPKTNSSIRDIPISSSLLPVLLEAKRISTSNFVVSNNVNFINPRTYEYHFHKELKKAGIRRINYHVLRHTFATRCIEAGVDVKSLSEILGHSNVSITLSTYVHSSMELKRQQIEKMSVMFPSFV